MSRDAALPAAAPAGSAVEVGPGLLRLRLPLPGPPGHVNAWLLDDGTGWLLVDTGLDTPELRQFWLSAFDTALDGRPITRVLVTHFHPDHVGLAGWICARFQAPLLMPRSEWLKAWLLLVDDREAILRAFIDLHSKAGSPEQHLDYLRHRGITYQARVAPLPRSLQPIGEGQVLRIGRREWQVMIGSGHAPEMACLWNPADEMLIAADHILPRISPHIGVTPAEPDDDPLGTYLASLARFCMLPKEALVLPSHGEPFHGLHARIDALIQHHRERLDLLRDAARAAGDTGLTAYDAAQAMFTKPLTEDRLSAAVSEAMAHLARLARLGELAKHTDAAGVMRFGPAALPAQRGCPGRRRQ